MQRINKDKLSLPSNKTYSHPFRSEATTLYGVCVESWSRASVIVTAESDKLF